MVKIRILTQHFYPDPASVGMLLTQLAISLAQYGFEVEVYTSQPRYCIPNELEKCEVYKSVNIYRLSGFKFNMLKKWGMALNYLHYFLKTFSKLIFSEDTKNVIYLIVSNPPFLHFLGIILKYLRNAKFVDLLYDINPQPYINVGVLSSRSLYIKLWSYLNKVAYKESWKIVVLSSKMKETIENSIYESFRNNEQSEKIFEIATWADEEFFKPVKVEENLFVKKNNLKNKFIINYAGTMGFLQKFESLLEVAKEINDDDVSFVFVGDGVKKSKLEKMKDEFKLKNVHFFPYQSLEMLPFAQAAAHLSVIHLEKEVEGYCFPSKLCSITATGSPVLALCDPESELGVMIKESKCGSAYNHEDISGIIDFIKLLKNDKSLETEFRNNSRRLFEKYFTKEIAIKKYLDLILEK